MMLYSPFRGAKLMGNLQNIQNQVKEKLFSSMVEGVARFPIPSTYPSAIEPSIDYSCSVISGCKSCSLQEARKQVVVANSFVSKMYFVLSDFPDKEDEASNEVYSVRSSLSSITINLLSKLEIQSSCHYSFAIKCLPERGLPENSLDICATQNLSVEILTVMPRVILCFGYRALQSLLTLDSSLRSHQFIENVESPAFRIKNLEIRLFFLSSIRDLRDFPHWRKQVWNILSPLTKEHSALS
jgi:uracil-DNA glycosylase